jgi:outer membrane receptor for ferric coprogen and ferric-rhodotorulic acid
VSVITRQQMEDQNLTQLTDVVSQAAGLTINQTVTSAVITRLFMHVVKRLITICSMA